MICCLPPDGLSGVFSVLSTEREGGLAPGRPVDLVWDLVVIDGGCFAPLFFAGIGLGFATIDSDGGGGDLIDGSCGDDC